jgi:hypothetical protein
MSWDKFNSSYNWNKIEDGETQTIAVMGEPEVQAKEDGTLSILFNVFNVDKGIHEVLRCGIVLAGKIKAALKDGKMLDKLVCVISRKGSGMDDTQYTVRAEDMKAEVSKAIKGIELHDLSKIPLPEGRKGRKGKKAKKS